MQESPAEGGDTCGHFGGDFGSVPEGVTSSVPVKATVPRPVASPCPSSGKSGSRSTAPAISSKAGSVSTFIVKSIFECRIAACAVRCVTAAARRRPNIGGEQRIRGPGYLRANSWLVQPTHGSDLLTVTAPRSSHTVRVGAERPTAVETLRGGPCAQRNQGPAHRRERWTMAVWGIAENLRRLRASRQPSWAASMPAEPLPHGRGTGGLGGCGAELDVVPDHPIAFGVGRAAFIPRGAAPRIARIFFRSARNRDETTRAPPA